MYSIKSILSNEVALANYGLLANLSSSNANASWLNELFITFGDYFKIDGMNAIPTAQYFEFATDKNYPSNHAKHVLEDVLFDFSQIPVDQTFNMKIIYREKENKELNEIEIKARHLDCVSDIDVFQSFCKQYITLKTTEIEVVDTLRIKTYF